MSEKMQEAETARYPVASLRDWAGKILCCAGLEDGAGKDAASQLLLADMMGVVTHGLARLPAYWHQLRGGGINARPAITESWRGTLLTVEADNALGQVAGPYTLGKAMSALGPSQPFVPFLIRDVGHLGALGTVLVEAAERGKIAFIAQVTQPVMAPAGSVRPVIGNNPIAFTAPRPNGPPLLFDFAASNVARGKIHMAAMNGERIPLGWAIDSSGNETDDPAAALGGSILPAADHKGMALAMMVEVMAGALTGARPVVSANGAPAGVGVFGFVCDAEAIAGSQYAAVMAQWTADYETGVGAHGRIPGSRAAALRIAAEREGLALTSSLVGRLVELGRQAGAEFPDAA